MRVLVVALVSVLVVSVIVGGYAFFWWMGLTAGSEGASVEVVREDGLKLIMSVNKTQYELGEYVNVTLTITNVGNTTITLIWGDYRILDFVVYNESLAEVNEWTKPAQLAVRTLTLVPDGEAYHERHIDYLGGWGHKTLESYTTVLIWKQDTSTGTQAPPGTYYIEGILVGGPEYSDHLTRREEMMTPKLEITIL